MLSIDGMGKACETLWQAVLEQAIRDDRWDVTARAWFCSKDQETGSFVWICTVLDLSPEFIQRLLVNRHNDGAICGLGHAR